MDDLQEAVKTVTMMSPPMLIIAMAFIVSFLLKPFLPERYIWPISTFGGGAVAPWMFSPASLSYEVPSPATALVIIDGIMGFLGSVFHRRIDRWIRNKFLGGGGGSNDTQQFTRDSNATRSGACPPPAAPPSTPDAPSRCD